MTQTAAIILAAGRSTRMKSELPKVLHEVGGRPMLSYVLDACRAAGVAKLVVVVGYAKESVIEAFRSQDDIAWVEQTEQLGTGHAVTCCEEALGDFEGEVLVLCGDGPLIRDESLELLKNTHRREEAVATLITAVVDDPSGYGRIARDAQGQLLGIVEHADCTEEQLKICEVNPSYYCFDRSTLFGFLKEIKPNNAQGEYYVTDVLRLVLESGQKAVAVEGVDAEDVLSINSQEQLALVNDIMQERKQKV